MNEVYIFTTDGKKFHVTIGEMSVEYLTKCIYDKGLTWLSFDGLSIKVTNIVAIGTEETYE